ncbi:MAG: UvrD-helicase domain-containing protein [Mangrovibacterium sp.]
MSELQIYKASAGAGKTFRLTIEYLKVVLQTEFAYKNILGVTFTNKATAEMKGRVLAELAKLSKGEKTAYLEVLLADKELNLSAEQIKYRSHNTLRRLLHDFSRFSISTIDSFFQRVIKSFNKELGINGNFQIELDSKTMIGEAVEQVILSIDRNEELFKWLKQFAQHNADEGKGWSIQRDIHKLANEILNDGFRDNADELFQILQEKGKLNNYRKSLQTIADDYFSRVNEVGKRGLKVLADAGLTCDDFSYKKTGGAGYFEKMSNSLFAEDKARMRTGAENYQTLLPKKTTAEAENTAPKISACLKDYFQLLDEEYYRVTSVNLILKNIYTLGILTHIQEKVQLIAHENSLSLLAESGKLLQKIIDNSDTPFIYERTGVYYKHFMIDEFQDTSALQWSNFRPLLGNSLAEENLAMLVGDVKQAIYRWRGGDWKLLENQVGKDFQFEGVQVHQLEQNWRSTGEIIRYNNRIFQLAPQIMQQQFNEILKNANTSPENYHQQIQGIYANGLQQIGQEKLIDKGYVHMRFFPKDGVQEERTSLTLGEMTATIKDLQDRGAKASDIAILVRKGKQAKEVANHLLEQKRLLSDDSPYNLSILSSESLLVSNSPAVCFLINLLRLVDNKKDRLTAAYANYQFYGIIEPSLHQKGATVNWRNVCPDYSESNNVDCELIDQFENQDPAKNPFYAFLQSDFMQKDLGSRNLQEMIFKLADFFHLFRLNDELSYMQAFVDSVSEFQKYKISDLNSFLTYWDDKGSKKTISASETLDAIRIQTVHKSKGLEYKFVLIPFCDWDVMPSGNQSPIVWCKPQEKPFNELNIVPIVYTKEMANSIFKDAYFEETQSMYIEALNLLYVAFTRARTELYTWATYNPKTYEENIKSVGDLLKLSLHNEANFSYDGQEELCSCLHQNYHAGEEYFEIGTKTEFHSSTLETPSNNFGVSRFAFCDFDEYLKLRKNHENFFVQDTPYEQRVNKGKIIHEALAQIKQKEELPHALQTLQFKGLFPQEELETYSEQIKTMISDPEVAAWFDGSYSVLNERAILLGNNHGLRRPDRIMVKGNEAVVVDYKSGELELQKYHKQVSEYMARLKECGFEKVSGYIWYTRSNKRERVESN